MNFDESPEEEQFRAEVREFLDAHAGLRKGDGTDTHVSPSTTGKVSEGAEDGWVQANRDWQKVLHDNGWAGLTWPTEYGGRGLSSVHQGIFNAEQARYDVPFGTFTVAIGMVGPTLIQFGTDAQKRAYLEPMLAGEHVWCQLFSEPGAGSDLANLSTRAVRDGDRFVVNGQKVWTSGAQYSDHGILLTRTDPTAHKHAGMTYFVVDMATAGIDVRPLVQITGVAHFNEVFLSDVVVPAANIVGEENKGWWPILATLAAERSAIGGTASLQWGDIADMAERVGATRDPLLRQELAKCYTRFQIQRLTSYRIQSASSHGRAPGPEVSTMKLSMSNALGANGDLFMRLLQMAGQVHGDPNVDGGRWTGLFLSQWAGKIGGGTDEIQRNIIGENTLGLPKEPRVDKGIPFTDIPTGLQ